MNKRKFKVSNKRRKQAKRKTWNGASESYNQKCLQAAGAGVGMMAAGCLMTILMPVAFFFIIILVGWLNT